MQGDLRLMMRGYAQAGSVAWIGLREERRAIAQSVSHVAVTDDGLVGDHGRAGKRAVTLIQAEHLDAIAAFLNMAEVMPERLRRNILISGINLAALKRRAVQLGTAVLCVEGMCPPCSRMEKELGPGGYSAVRGHGGWYASVVTPGEVRVGDTVMPVD